MHKLGVAGNEAAEIIESNVRDLTSLSMDREECRAIALLYFPSAELNQADLCSAYLRLKMVAREVYGRVPLRVLLQLFGLLFWSILKRFVYLQAGNGSGAVHPYLPAELLKFCRYPAVAVASICAFWLSLFGERNVKSVRKSVLPAVMKHLR